MILRFILGFAVELLAETVRWLAERPIRFLIVALLLCCAWLYVARGLALDLADDRRDLANSWRATFFAQRAEMRKFGDLVVAGRIEAARLDRVNADRVRRVWAATLEEKTHDYQAELGAVRAAVADRLRQAGEGAGAERAGGGGADAQLSGLPVLSSGTVRAGHAAIVDADDIDACTVNTLRLEHLVDAWQRAAAIDVNRP